MPARELAEVQALYLWIWRAEQALQRRRKSCVRMSSGRQFSSRSVDQANGGSRRERGEEIVGAGEIEGETRNSVPAPVSGYYAAQDFRTQEEITRRWISLVPSSNFG